MSNPDIERFLTNLCTAFSKRLTSEAFNLYIEKLEHWHLTSDQWSSSCSRIISDEETFPKIAQIIPYLKLSLKSAKHTTRKDSMIQMFTVKDVRYARPVSDQVPILPEGAFNEVIVIPQDLRFSQDEPRGCTQAEARESFSRGFVDAGGSLDKLDAYFGILRTRIPEPSPEEVLVTDDDIPF